MPEVGGRKTCTGRENMQVLSGSGIAIQLTGDERERTANDWYPTDPQTVEACYRSTPLDIRADQPFMVLDPGAGTGVWGRVLRKLYPIERYPLLKIVGVEMDSGFTQDSAYDLWINENFITGSRVATLIAVISDTWPGFDAVVGNPPYELDTEFLAQAFRLVNRNTGRVDFLYRLGFLAAEERVFDFYGRGYAASRALVCNTRPCFLPESEQLTKGKRATYPGDFTYYIWQFEGGMPDQAKTFDHLVFKTCKICGAVYFPTARGDRFCPEHTTTPVVAGPVDFGRYIQKGYEAFLSGQIRKAEKRAGELSAAGNLSAAADQFALSAKAKAELDTLDWAA